MHERLKVLIVEDSNDDLLLIIRALKTGGLDIKHRHVQSEAEFVKALDDGTWDVVVSDYSLPGFSGLKALEHYKKRNFVGPFIIVSGNIGEETAVAAMREGAVDYLLKDRLARLGPAIYRALERGRLRRERRRSEAMLRNSEESLRLFRTLVDQSSDTFEIVDPEGVSFGLAGRQVISLCRCGMAENKPFCDGSHGRNGFMSECKARDLPPPVKK